MVRPPKAEDTILRPSSFSLTIKMRYEQEPVTVQGEDEAIQVEGTRTAKVVG